MTTSIVHPTGPPQNTAGRTRAFSITEESEFNTVVRQYGRSVLRYAAARVGPSAAEDVVNETFAAAWRQRSRFDPGRGFTIEAWLIGIAHRAVQQHRRDEVRWLKMCEDTCAANSTELFADFDEVEESVMASSTIHAAMSCLRNLPARQRSPLLMSVIVGLSYDEIAAALDVPVGTVRSRINRARRRLREALI